MNRRLTDTGLYALLAAGGLALLALWAADDLKAWLGPLFARPVAQTQVLGKCLAPADPTEQLHVVIGKRGEQLVLVGCMFVGSTGTYNRRWSKQ